MIFLGLGSNIGNKVDNLRNSIVQMEKGLIRVVRCSALYQTPAWGMEDQDDFVNAVCEVSFDGEPSELLQRLQAIEEEMGRQRMQKWGPRLIDLDILEYHRFIVQEASLTLPHPYYPQRPFVLVPMLDLEPDWIPTGHDTSIFDLLEELPKTNISRMSDPLMISGQG